MTNEQAEGLHLAIHELNHLRNRLDSAMTNISGLEKTSPRAKLYAIRELMAFDIELKDRIKSIEGMR